MSNTKSTVNDILQIMADVRGESSVDVSSKRIRMVSRAEKDFARRIFWRTFLLKDQTTVGYGNNDYEIGSATYPFRPKGLMEVMVATTGDTPTQKYSIVDFNNFKDLYIANNGERMVYEWYNASDDKWNMHINPAPAVTETITYSFFWEPPTRTTTTAAIICPNPKIIALLALADLAHSEDEIQTEQLLKNEAEQLIAELVGLENTPAINQTYSMRTAEGKGFGTY
jgi:hypothetical protein